MADEIEQSLIDVIRAWEIIPGGTSYTSEVIQQWLIVDMKPAIDRARVALGRPEARRHDG